MKYYAEPHLSIIDYDRMKLVFKFDENGEFETQDSSLITWMKKNKGFIRCHEDLTQTIDPGPIEKGHTEHVCKKCGAVFENKGKYMSHIRINHPKDKT